MSWSAGGALPSYFLLLLLHHVPLSLTLFLSVFLLRLAFFPSQAFLKLSVITIKAFVSSQATSPPFYFHLFSIPVTGYWPNCWAEVRKLINRSVGDLAEHSPFAPASVAERADSPPPSGLDRTGHFSSAQVQVTRQVRCYLYVRLQLGKIQLMNPYVVTL